MSKLATNFSSHALKRMQQRAMSFSDVDTIMAYGTPVQDGYLLTPQDASEAISSFKREIQIIERLKNRVIIINEGKVITMYPTSKRKQKQLLKTF